jgi:hypothetical protein
MDRIQVAKELVRHYLYDEIKGQPFACRVWKGMRGSWEYTRDSTAFMANDGKNILLKAETMRDINNENRTKNEFIRAVESWLRKKWSYYS